MKQSSKEYFAHPPIPLAAAAATNHPKPALFHAQVLDYNVPHGKLNRGLAVVDAVRTLQPGATAELRRQAAAVGWCIELLQAYFLVADDMMDGSVTRRGQPCWYRVPDVGTTAINDGILLEAALYRVLKNHAGQHVSYPELLELFLDVTFRTAHGQLLDTVLAPRGRADLSEYTESSYLRIVEYKTAYYTFYLPIAAALLLAGRGSAEALSLARSICVKMGVYFQVQDDVLDAFGDPEAIGKIGTDIQDNKCSWLVVQALARATPEQVTRLRASYGKDDEASIADVKALYRDLGLQAAFDDYEAAVYAELVEQINGQDLLPTA
ncbi:MAG: hypothetical protein DI537_50880, partial [Stutzerimonas stutzeri]